MSRTTPTATLLDRLASLAVIAAASVVVWNGVFRSAPGAAAAETFVIPTDTVPIAEAPALGDPRADVVVIEYSDFECPFCQRFAAEIQPVLRDEFVDSGQVQWTFKHLPLESIHPRALEASIAAECADAQGLFWPMHDWLLAHGAAVDLDAVTDPDGPVGASRDPLASCLEAADREEVDRNIAEAKSLGIRSTPTFLVGVRDGDGVRIVDHVPGARPVEDFRAAIESALSASSGS